MSLWDLSIHDSIAQAVAGRTIIPTSLRWRLLRRLGIDIQQSTWYGGVSIAGAKNLSVGEASFINSGVLLDSSGGITIGQRVSIGQRVQIISTTHIIGSSDRRASELQRGSVTIEDGAWIGAGAIILPGIRVGRGAIVGAGSVVISNCDADALYAGNPATKKRQLD